MFFGVVCLFFAVPGSAHAKGVDDWLAQPSVTAAYGSLAPEIRAYAAELRQLSLSDSLLLMRLEEASNKKASLSALQSSIRTDMELIRLSARSLKSRLLYPTKEKDATRMIEKAILLLRTGIDKEEFEMAIDAALGKAGPKAKPDAVLSRAFSALAVTAAADATYSFSDASRHAFIAYLISSNLSEKKFDSAVADIAKRVRAGVPVDVAVAAILKATANEEPSGKSPPDKEKTSGGGKPQDSGKPESPGKPDDTGKPDNPGNPGNPGKK
jgi:hypothetical protein